MRKNVFILKCLVTVIIFLFILSIFTQFVIGIRYDLEINNKELLNDLVFDYHNEYDPLIEDYFDEYLIGKISDDCQIEEVKQTLKISENEKSDNPMDSPWPMKCHDTKHTGRSPYSTADNNGVEIWRFECDWVEGGSVIDKDGIIYFGSFDDYLYALYPNGTLKWKFKTNGWIWSTPALAEDGTIYIGTYGDRLYAINTDGTLKWSFNAEDSISSSPAIAEDGTIYFGVVGPGWDKGRVYALNSDGAIKWHYDTEDWIYSDPAIGDDGTIYIGSCDTYLYAMNPDGSLKWRFKTGDIVKSHPSISDDGIIYFGSFDGYLYALYPNGTMKWKHSGSYGGSSSAIIDKDGIIYNAGKNKLQSIYPNGTLKWSYDLGNRRIGHSSPAISVDGTIYIGTIIGEGAGGEVFAINSDGTLKWRSGSIADEWIQSSPSISSNGTVYIGSSSLVDGIDYGYLHAFSGGESNQPPNKPTITGTISGKTGTSYNYTIVTTDPEKDDISYYIDWDDGTEGFWTRMLPSGEPYNVSHIWTERGDYVIRAKARDIYELESDWVVLEVSMPKNRNIVDVMLDRFPIFRFLYLGF